MVPEDDIPENPGFWWKLVHLNPALWRGLIVSIVVLVGAFGLVISDHQSEGVLGLIISVTAIVQALWTRGAVTANKKVVVYKPDPVEAPEVVAAGPAVSTDVYAVAKAAADQPAQ